MINRKSIKKLLSILVVLILLVGTTGTSFAAKGGNGGGKPSKDPSPPVIETMDFLHEMEVGQVFEFEVTASFKPASSLVWTVIPEGYLVEVGQRSYTKKDNKVVVTYRISPVEGAVSQLFNITATDPTTDLNDVLTVNVIITEQPVIEAFNYVAIGDSLATGTVAGPANLYETPYVTKFEQYLEALDPSVEEVTLQNLAQDGITSSDLLNDLRNDSSMQNALRDAELITVSIGGNNLMQAAKKSLLGITYYDFTDINEALAEAGRDQFALDWPLIVDELRSLNASAPILTINMFNPYNEVDAMDPDGYHAFVDDLLYDPVNVDGINNTLENGSGYYLVDIFSEFNPYTFAADPSKDMRDISYMYYEGSYWGFPLRNPHPNSDGQDIITSEHIAVYQMINP